MKKQIAIASLLLSFSCALHAQYREIPLPFPDTTRFEVQFIDEMHGWVSSMNGNILRTTDGGNTWTRFDSPHPNKVSHIDFSTTDYGVLWADSTGNGFGKMYRTTNGGETWKEVKHFDSTNIGSYLSTDVWRQYALKTTARNQIVYDGQRSYYLGGGGMRSEYFFAYSSDDGVTWHKEINENKYRLKTVFLPLDATTWGILDAAAEIPDITPVSGFRLSTDRGKTWRFTKIWNDMPMLTAEFTDAKRGIVFHARSYVVRGGISITRDGGETWENWDYISTGHTGRMINDSVVYYVDPERTNPNKPYFGTLMRTTRRTYRKVFPYMIYSISTVGENVYVLTVDGKLFVIDNRLVSIKNDGHLNSPQPIECNLFPNPFGSATKSGNQITSISFTLPEAQHVRLSVIDLLGREVAVLVNEEETDGNHVVEFNGDGLPSGMYQLVLMAGEKVVTLKMNLVK